MTKRKNETPNFTFDDILQEIERLSNTNPDGFSIQEMARATGHAQAWCRRKIGDLMIDGKVKCNGRKKAMRIDGAHTFVPVYVVIGE